MFARIFFKCMEGSTRLCTLSRVFTTGFLTFFSSFENLLDLSIYTRGLEDLYNM